MTWYNFLTYFGIILTIGFYFYNFSGNEKKSEVLPQINKNISTEILKHLKFITKKATELDYPIEELNEISTENFEKLLDENLELFQKKMKSKVKNLRRNQIKVQKAKISTNSIEGKVKTKKNNFDQIHNFRNFFRDFCFPIHFEIL